MAGREGEREDEEREESGEVDEGSLHLCYGPGFAEVGCVGFGLGDGEVGEGEGEGKFIGEDERHVMTETT